VKKVLAVSLAGVSSLFLVLACSKSNTGRFGEVSGEVSESFARAVLDAPTTLSNLFVGNIPAVNVKKSLDRSALKMVQNGMFRMATSPLGSCESVGTGDVKDKDADDLPVDGIFKVDCSSPNEYLKSSYTLKDHNDALEFPKAGMSLKFESIEGRLANHSGSFVDFNLEASDFEIKVEGASTAATGSAAATLKVGSSRVDLGFEGSANYLGNIHARREGDKVTVAGKIRWTGASINGIADADFVAQIDANLVMGDCGGGDIMVKSGTAAIKDAQHLIIKAVATNCEVKLSYDGASMPINRSSSIPLPKY